MPTHQMTSSVSHHKENNPVPQKAGRLEAWSLQFFLFLENDGRTSGLPKTAAATHSSQATLPESRTVAQGQRRVGQH